MSEALAAWNGYAFDVPGGPGADSRYPGAELDLRRLLYARALSQLEKRPVLLGPSEAAGLAVLPGPGRVMGVIA